MEERKYLTTKEAAEYLRIKLSYCYKLVCLGKIPNYKPAGRVYFLLEELDEYIRRGRRAADYELSEEAERILNAPPRRGRNASKYRFY
jgi:excisionase family DNA binding protein